MEITKRTNAGRLHLKPSAELNAAILAILGRALALYPVILHAIVFTSNHYHALATALDGKALSDFICYLHANVAKAAQAINGVEGKVWGKPTSIIPVLDDGAQLQRLKYVLGHGTKEGLVQSPLIWPGVTAARALVGEERLVGRWVDHELRRSLSRHGRKPHPAEYTIEYPIELAPLPVHEGLSAEQRCSEVRAMIREIEAEHPGPFLGVEGVLAQDPQSKPRNPIEVLPPRTAPPVHTTSPVLRLDYRRLRNAYCDQYRGTAAKHSKQPTLFDWPFDSFLPARTFVRVRPAPTLFEMLRDARFSGLGSSSA